MERLRCDETQQPNARGCGQGFQEDGGENDQEQGHDQKAQRLAEVHRAFYSDGAGVETHKEVRASPE